MKARITDLYKEAEAFRRHSNEDWWSGQDNRNQFMAGRQKKKFLESWILGRFADAFNANESQRIIFAKEREKPDFALYNASGEAAGFAEITEWLSPGRKRDKEYSSPPPRKCVEVSDDPELRAEAINGLRCQIKNKLHKARHYPEETRLIIYFNVSSVLWDESDPPDKAEADSVSEIIRDLRESIPSTISEIWLLSPIRGIGSIINQVYPRPVRHEGNWLTKALNAAD